MQANLARLCTIIGAILREQYGIQRLSMGEQAALIEKHMTSLSQWKEGIASFMDGLWTNANLLIPPFSRQCTVLNLAHSHAIVLTNRPLLLCSAAKLARILDCGNAKLHSFIQESSQHCVNAAAIILKIVTDLCERQRMYGAFWVQKSI